jgi:predicted RND superfamily exporter protein
MTAPLPQAETETPRSSPLFTVSLVTLALLALSVPFILRAAIAVMGADSTTPIEWVPDTFPPRQAYQQFTTEFESGDVVVASWSGCTLGAPAIDRFISVANGPDAPRDRQGRLWFEPIVAGSTVLERLTEPPLALDRQTAIERLQGMLVGPDGETTCLVIPFTPEGLADRRRAVEWIRSTLLQTATPVADELHLTGPVIENVTVDQASGDSLRLYGGPAAFIILALTWWSLRSLRYALLVFVLSLLCVGICFWSLHAWGDRMNPVLIVMPLLVLTLGVSGGIHLVNYLVEAAENGPREGVARRAVALGWLPCSLSAGTTALGLISLVVSELEPIRVFGFHAAFGVVATLVVLFLVVPGIFERWPIGSRAQHASDGASASWFADTVVRRSMPISAAALAALAVTGSGVPLIRASVGLDTLFTGESQLFRDYRWLEARIGPLAPIEVVVRFAKSSPLRPAERLDIVREVGAAVESLPGVSGLTSAALFLPDLPEASGLRGALQKAAVARKLESNLTQLADMSVIREVSDEQLWRVTARTSALAGLDYGEFLRRVRAAVDPIVATHGGAAAGVAADCTGVLPLINAIQKTLLDDLFASFLSACAVITLVMMAVERGVLAGLVAMIPNVFPMVLLFGVIGWIGWPIDIGSTMTASIALGMAVDGTFHFLTFFRRGLSARAAARGGVATADDRAAAVHDAYRHSAAALTQSAIVCGLGILAFAASSFAPTRRFAWMLSLLVWAALIGDLVVLPALLSGPAGRWFKPRLTSPLPRGRDPRLEPLKSPRP